MTRGLFLLLGLVFALGGCASLAPLEATSAPKTDKLALNEALPDPLISRELAAGDKAMLSLLHDRASVNCLVYKNKVSAIITFAGITVTDGDLLFAAVPTALAAANVATGPLVIVSSALASLSPTFQHLLGVPQPATYQQSAAGIDTMYSMFTLSPGIAWGLNDPAHRSNTLKLIRVGYQQACLSATAMPLTSIYAPPIKPAGGP